MILKRFSPRCLCLLSRCLPLLCISPSQAQTNEKPQSSPKYPNYPSETPTNLKPVHRDF